MESPRIRNTRETQQEPQVILLVEDNPAHAELVQRSLEDHRVANKVYHVFDGKMALAYLFRQGSFVDAEKSPRPHLILLDLRLPKISGLDVLRIIKTTDELHNIPVVILTTSEAERDIKRAYEQHVNGYVVKPVDSEQFTRLMKEFGYFWLEWNRAPLTVL